MNTINLRKSGMLEMSNGTDFNAMPIDMVKSVIIVEPGVFSQSPHLNNQWRTQVHGEGYITLLSDTREEAARIATQILDLMDWSYEGHFENGAWIPNVFR